MNILVTGGCGFIGSNLCKYLLDQGHNVLCVDNLSSGFEENVEDLTGNSGNFYFKNIDVERIMEPEFCLGYINDIFKKKLDQIYHLACPASPKFYQQDPIKTISTCINGTKNVLELARYYNSTILLTSTSEVYGEPLEHPQTEEYRGNVNSLGIRACYDEGKRLAETLMMEYNRMYNVDVKIVRIFNTYGPNMSMDDGRVVTNFISQALNNKDITIYGDGLQTRSLCYVSDMVKGLVLMMNSKEIGPINLGNPVEISMNELAKKILGITLGKSVLVYCKLPQDDPTRRCPDITKARTLLNWEPSVSLCDGISQMIGSIIVRKFRF